MNSPASNTPSLDDKTTITDWSVSSSLFDRIVTPESDVHTSTQCTGGRYHGLWSYCSLWVAPRVPQSRTASPTWPASSWWQAMCTLHPKIIWTPSRELSCWRIVWRPAQAMIPATLSTMRRGSVCSSLPMQMPAQVSLFRNFPNLENYLDPTTPHWIKGKGEWPAADCWCELLTFMYSMAELRIIIIVWFDKK